MKKAVAAAALVAAVAAGAAWAQDNARERAEALVAQMTLDEKLSFVAGTPVAWPKYTGNLPGLERLGIPRINFLDGPQGVRTSSAPGTTTSYPSAATLSSAWDPALTEAFAATLGAEFREKGASVALSVAVNIHRVPTGGRNFEYLSGEDPYLGEHQAAAYVRGLQSQGLVANVKHYAFNNQEENRMRVSANVDEKTAWELYYPPHEGAVDAGVRSVMCAYNRVNETFACESGQLLEVDLRQRMGFDGFVVSDWTATKSTVPSALNGLDLEMPATVFYGAPLEEAIANGAVPVERVDGMVANLLTAVIRAGVLDREPTGDYFADTTSPERSALARRIGAESAVLLHNEGGVLPLGGGANGSAPVRRIAVLGDVAHLSPIVNGGGSGSVQPPYIVTPYDGIAEAAAARGIAVAYVGTANLTGAVAEAAAADVAVVFMGTFAMEFADRPSLSLPAEEEALVAAVLDAQPNTVVVLNTPGAVLMPWADRAAAVLLAMFQGQENGHATADVLFGEVSPSGKLIFTMPNKENEVGFTEEQYPGVDLVGVYSEGLLNGYRWYDAAGVQPKFAFGHGVSYTTFGYSNLTATTPLVGGGYVKDRVRLTVEATVQNTGGRAGAEVAQLYLGFPADQGQPPKLLKGFRKVFLQPGEAATVSFPLRDRDVAVWSVEAGSFVLAPGRYAVYVGASSRDIRLTGAFDVVA